MSCWCGCPDHATRLRGSWNRGTTPSPIKFEVAVCERCGLARTLPPPRIEGHYDHDGSQWAIASLKDDWSDRIARMIIDGSRGPRVLDIGCSVGNFVAAAAALGAQAEGIELSPAAVARGRHAGRNIHNRRIEDQLGTWDAIALHHVLEHVEDLEMFLRHIDRLTAPGGRVFIFVPFHRGVVPRLMGDRWFAWSPDEHVWHFEPRTLTNVVETSSSLRKVRVVCHGAIEPPSAGFKGVAKRLISRAASRLGWGDQIVSVYEKPRATNPPL